MIIKIKNFLIKTLASGFGLGYAPKAPGTFGTLLALPIVWWLQTKNPFTYMLVTFLFSVFACIIAELAGSLFGKPDSPKIVIDEVAGYIVTMVWLPHTWQALALGFILFRFFDAVKPGPIGYLDRKVKGGIGVVVDDIAAGIGSNIVLQVLYNYSDILGARLS